MGKPVFQLCHPCWAHMMLWHSWHSTQGWWLAESVKTFSLQKKKTSVRDPAQTGLFQTFLGRRGRKTLMLILQKHIGWTATVVAAFMENPPGPPFCNKMNTCDFVTWCNITSSSGLLPWLHRNSVGHHLQVWSTPSPRCDNTLVFYRNAPSKFSHSNLGASTPPAKASLQITTCFFPANGLFSLRLKPPTT